MKKILLIIFVVSMLQAASGAGSTDPFTVPNDPFFPQQWSLQNDGDQKVIVDVDDMHTVQQPGTPGADIGWVEAQGEVSTRATNPVTVAVIDSGLDTALDSVHPDLADRIAPGGYDFLANPNYPDFANPNVVTDPEGHGTNVSGIIAADAKNPRGGVIGIAPQSVRILPLRVLWNGNDPKGTTFTYRDPKSTLTHPTQKFLADFTADAVVYAWNHGASVINISLGWPKVADTQNARDAFATVIKGDPAHNHPGSLIVVAAGNDKKDQPTFPCAYEGVLCVGSITNTGAMALYSNYGGMVDILSPGDGIISTYPRHLESQVLRIPGYEMMSGTSQATPQVVGVAAVLKSIYPTLSTDELEARLLASTGKLPSSDAALYGLVNLQKAIDVKPQPVYLPDFKVVDEIPVDEDTLQVQGQISVKNLWEAASGVQAQILVNGKISGSVKAEQLASGDSLIVPWTYQFASLDDSSMLKIELQITDASGTSKSFSINASAVRDTRKIKSSRTFAVPGVPASYWIEKTFNGILHSRIGSIDSYPPEPGLPRYYEEYDNPNATGSCSLQIYDPSTPSLFTQVVIPGIGKIEQVIHVDLTGSGKKDWVVTGYDAPPQSKPGPTYWEFYFLDSNFQPLYGSVAASEYQVSNSGGQQVARNYATPGSWIQAGGKLLPSFFANGMLPKKDSFSELDSLYWETGNHLFYWSPLPPAAGVTGAPVQLELRALDNAAFYRQNPDVSFLNFIPGSPADMTAGHIRVLAANGPNLFSPTLIWDVNSLGSASLSSTAGWDLLSSNGAPYSVLTSSFAPSTTGFAGSLDSARESIAWADTNGNFLNRTEFSFSSPEDPMGALIGAFEFPNLGRFWFIQTGFELVGYRQAFTTGATVQMQTISLERESTFKDQFSAMLSPVVVGTSEKPLAGVYQDSTLVRGNQVSVAVWDPTSNTIVKPLRYSLQIPQGCLGMNPVRLAAGPESFALPIICPEDKDPNQLQVQIVQPTATK